MKNWKMPLAVVLAVALVAGAVWAGGESLMQGQDSTGTVRYLLVDSQGRVVTTSDPSGGGSSAAGTHGACTSTVFTTSSSTTVNCPTTPRADRATIVVQNTTATLAGVGSNGIAGVASNAFAGVVLGQYDVYTDNLAGTVNAQCLCPSGSCTFYITECP